MVYMRSGVMAPLILNLTADGLEQLPQQYIQTLPLKQSPHPTTRNPVDPKCRSGEFRGNKNLLSLPGIEQNFLGYPARVPSRLPYGLHNIDNLFNAAQRGL
jgi:hypothetical protein